MPFRDPVQQREYQRLWLQRRREAWLSGRTCGACGATDALEVHHRDTATAVSHRVWSWSAVRRDAELTKCDVLCGPCHDELHSETRRLPCGTSAAYQRGCRCVKCRRASADRNLDYRRRRRLAASVVATE